MCDLQNTNSQNLQRKTPVGNLNIKLLVINKSYIKKKEQERFQTHLQKLTGNF